MRKPIPSSIERDLLIRNKHCCCICQKDGHGKEILLHHIDGDNSNNTAKNLAVLCLIHASQADAGLVKGKLGSGRKLKPADVIEYKELWEKRNLEENKIQKKRIPPYRKRQLGSFYYQEMHKIKHEILALDHIDPNDKIIKIKFAFLQSLTMEEYIYDIKVRKSLMDVYIYLAAMAIESGTLLIRGLTQAIEQQYIINEYEYADILPEDVYFLRGALEALAILGDGVASYNTNPTALKIVCKALFTIGKIAKLAKLEPEKQRVYRALKKIRTSCVDFRAANKTNTAKQRQLRQQIVESELVRLTKPR
jgi:hypothetical protein